MTQPPLERGGIACVQTILIPDDRWKRYRKAPDWIEQYVFPGCLIPSLTALTAAATASSRLTMLDVHEIGPHYVTTVQRWRTRFREQLDEVLALGFDERFCRTWEFYLAYCEAAFASRAISDVQLVLVRPFERDAPTFSAIRCSQASAGASARQSGQAR